MAEEDKAKPMKKYNINNEIPVPPPLVQEEGGAGDSLEHMLSSIDHQHEFSEEERRLTALIEAVRLLVTRLESFATSNDKTKKKIGEQAHAIRSLVYHLEEHTDKLKTIVIQANLSPQSMNELDKYVTDIIEKEKKLLDGHRKRQNQEWDKQNNYLKTIVHDNKGVWLSNKVFWWAIGIFELAICIAIYFGGKALVAAIG